MNFFSKLCVTGLILASSSALAFEPAPGWYGGLMAGLSWAPGVNYTVVNPTPPPATYTNQVTYALGGNGGGQIGFRCYKFRYEAEFMFNYNAIQKLALPGFTLRSNSINGFHIKGYTDFAAALFNVFYEFYDLDYDDTRWVPYLGLGIGYTHVRTVISYYFDNVKYNRFSSSASVPIGQAILGINYFFTDFMSLGTDLRYMLTRNISTFDSRASVITWNVVFNYSFDGIGLG